MVTPHVLCRTGAICAMLLLGLQAQTATTPIPDFAPDDHTSWYPDRPDGDNYLPPESGPGPIMQVKDYPYVPNAGFTTDDPELLQKYGRRRTNDDFASTKPTYRIADLSNPILRPWVRQQMQSDNDEVRAGKVPFMARERCYPGGVPEFEIFRRVAPPMIFFVQTPKEVLMIWRGDSQVRHVYMNVPHSKNPAPSWYGESVGHYEGDTLVVDTIGQNTKTFVDGYRTPHTTQEHVVERFKIVNGGKALDVSFTVDDAGTFYKPWSGRRPRYRENARMAEDTCAANNDDKFNLGFDPVPTATTADF